MRVRRRLRKKFLTVLTQLQHKRTRWTSEVSPPSQKQKSATSNLLALLEERDLVELRGRLLERDGSSKFRPRVSSMSLLLTVGSSMVRNILWNVNGRFFETLSKGTMFVSRLQRRFRYERSRLGLRFSLSFCCGPSIANTKGNFSAARH